MVRLLGISEELDARRRRVYLDLAASLLISALVACGDGDVGEAHLVWVTPADDGAERSRRIDTWAFVANGDSRFAPHGVLVHIEFPLPDRGRGQLELDLPVSSIQSGEVLQASVDGDAGVPPAHPEVAVLHYRETRNGRVVFDGVARSGGVLVGRGELPACACGGGAFDLRFVDEGSDGVPGSDDDQVRALKRGTFELDDDTCVPLRVPQADAGVALSLQDTCGPAATVPPTVRLSDSPGTRGAPTNLRRRRSVGTGVVVVPAHVVVRRDPYARDDSGCAAGGCSTYDESGRGCGAAGGTASSGCDDDGGNGSAGCEGDDDADGCGDSGGGGGCEGDDDYAARLGDTGSPRQCQLRRGRRSILSGALQNYLMIGFAAAGQWFSTRRGQRRTEARSPCRSSRRGRWALLFGRVPILGRFFRQPHRARTDGEGVTQRRPHATVTVRPRSFE